MKTLLVANRGEIACRIIRAARAMGIRTVAVYADPDAHARHVRTADRAVALRGTTSAETYLDAGKVVAAAQTAGADAVHPGYGFLAENADFADAVLAAGLTWVGPPPDAMRAMGDKLTALARMSDAGVPTLPRAEVDDLDVAAAAGAAQSIGFPLIVKPSAGGGGKGMRIVTAAGELRPALEGAAREARSAFGDDRLFLERYVEAARHIEVQVFGDADGRVRHLFERECSIQRRHQKVIEEAPSPFVDAELREQLGKTAVAAAEAVGYVGAGTVELIMGADRSYYFLEMNTRLQVEHPVTELVTGVDLVRQQLLVAQGREPEFDAVTLTGAAVEARVYAEDPSQDFLPQSGRLLVWREPSSVRVDSGVDEGDEVSAYFDPLLAKVIAHGADRREAAARLARALEQLRVHGLRTNRDFLVNVLDHPAFLDGDTTIDFIDRMAPARSRTVGRAEVVRAVVAAGVADRRTPAITAWPPSIPAGFGITARYVFRHGDDELTLELVDGERVRVDGNEVDVRVHAADDEWLDLEVDGLRERVSVARDAGRVWVQGSAGEVALTEVPRLPDVAAEAVTGSLVAPMNGAVVAVEVAVGDEVAAGQVIVVLEAMKMEHRVSAPVAGVVRELHAEPGASVAAGTVLAVVDPAEENESGTT